MTLVEHGIEVLPDSASPWDPDARHAVCGHILRSAMARRTEALCGVSVAVPLPPDMGGPKCAGCLGRAAQHAERCDCFKVWPGGRMPR